VEFQWAGPGRKLGLNGPTLFAVEGGVRSPRNKNSDTEKDGLQFQDLKRVTRITNAAKGFGL